MDDVYENETCLLRCVWVGTLECPSYRKWLQDCHAKVPEVKPITEICKQFAENSDICY